MARDERKRQKKLEKKKAKREAKKAKLAKRFADSVYPGVPDGLLPHLPVHEARVSDAVFSNGIGPVVLSRALQSGRIAFSSFLVDYYCLGVKDAFRNVLAPVDYREFIEQSEVYGAMRAVEPPCARKLVEGAVDYARAIGIEPHRDYDRARFIFGDIDAGECPEEFVYGKNGKPLFVSGPHDSPEKINRILAALRTHCEPDGFECQIMDGPMGGDMDFDDDDDEDYEDEDEDEEDEEGR